MILALLVLRYGPYRTCRPCPELSLGSRCEASFVNYKPRLCQGSAVSRTGPAMWAFSRDLGIDTDVMM